MKFYWTWTDKKEVKLKREAQLPWELRGTKEEGSIKCCIRMNTRVRERRDISVSFPTSILVLLPGVQTTTVNTGLRAFPIVLQKLKLIL